MTPYNCFGHRIASIAAERGGSDPSFHELTQIAIIPLGNDYGLLKGKAPFHVYIKPVYPERLDREGVPIRKAVYERIMDGISRDDAIAALESWVKSLSLGFTQKGWPRRIMPLGCEYNQDYSFIVNWLGPTLYNELFHNHTRDVMSLAISINDYEAFRMRETPFRNMNLTQLCGQLDVEYYNKHDCLSEAVSIAKLYCKLLQWKAPTV